MDSTSLSKPSLISYLVPSDNRFFLDLSKDTQEDEINMQDYPFSMVSSSDPLSIIIKAVLKTDADSAISDVFIILEKEEYGLTEDAIWPINNLDVNKAWQGSFSLLTTQGQETSLIILKEQVDDKNNLRRLYPLFYCKEKGLFFHPSCPKCGKVLKLCTDDDLLTKYGLRAYSSSMKRYLYCAECGKSGREIEFYVHFKGAQDPSFLKDQKELINELGNADLSKVNEGGVPCQECTHFNECYGSQDLALSRVITLSFYPFFMLLLKAPSLNLLEFLPLISGAKPQEIMEMVGSRGEADRERFLKCFNTEYKSYSMFLFEEDDRIFLEILYLKLSLLGEIAGIILSDLEKWRHPDLGLSVDRIWVSLADKGAFLPLLWNFRLRYLGVGSVLHEGFALSKMPPGYGLYLLGSIWFFVLLSNSRNKVHMIHEQVTYVLENSLLEEDDSIPVSSMDRQNNVFAPENIFWAPTGRVIDPSWQTLWKEALDPGFFLLKCHKDGISKWSEDDFRKGLTRTRDRIKETLFLSRSRGGPTGKEADKVTDKGIYEILNSIYNKWQQEIPGTVEGEETSILKTPGDKAGPLDDVIEKETVLLKPEEFGGDPETPQISEADTKKVFLSTSQPLKESSDAHIAQEPLQEEGEDLPKTVIMKADQTQQEDVSLKDDIQEDEIPETVIISTKTDSAPDETGSVPGVKERTHPAAAENRSDEKENDKEDIPETVILKVDDNK